MTPPTPQEAVRVALDCPVPGRRTASFVEHDLVDSRLEPVDRPLGSQDCGVVVGVMTHWFEGHAGPTQRVWLAGSVTPYRDLRQTLPPQFARQRAASQSITWHDVALTAYDASTAPEPVADVPQALRWGLDILSPLDFTCQP